MYILIRILDKKVDDASNLVVCDEEKKPLYFTTLQRANDYSLRLSSVTMVLRISYDSLS